MRIEVECQHNLFDVGPELLLTMLIIVRRWYNNVIKVFLVGYSKASLD